jgi:phosphatidylserine/phosphatidylglycerophosphate/cardiolipin synthase-like enzyme
MARQQTWLTALIVIVAVAGHAERSAADQLCEARMVDCRQGLINYINREAIRLDIGMEEMTDPAIADAVIGRFKAKVPVRVIVEPRRSVTEPRNATILATLKAAGIPMRYRKIGDTFHWKMMIFAGQNTVEFAAAQFTESYLVPVEAGVNFTQDPIFYSTETSFVNSFERKFDDAWVDEVNFAEYANSPTVARVYALYQIDPALNFVPANNFASRSKPLYDAERTAIDVIMYKVTDLIHADAMIRAVKRGVPVRLITEPTRYRSTDNLWQAYNLDRMYAAGVQIRERAHLGFLHQKTTLLHSQTRTIFGSSNWTTASDKSQYEHNYFATDPTFFDWFQAIFARKWSSASETRAFVPLPPDVPVYVAPANASSGWTTTVTLSWKPGPWARAADVYLGTSASPALYAAGLAVTANVTKKLVISGLMPGTAYYWKIVSKTMANKTASGPVWSFGT